MQRKKRKTEKLTCFSINIKSKLIAKSILSTGMQINEKTSFQVNIHPQYMKMTILFRQCCVLIPLPYLSSCSTNFYLQYSSSICNI